MKYLLFFLVSMSVTNVVRAQQQAKTQRKVADSTSKISRITSVTLSAPSEEYQRESAIKYLNEMVGKKIEYCTFFYGGKYDANSGTTYLYFGAAKPNQNLTVLINKRDRKKFDYSPITKFVNKELCINGVVSNNNGSIEVNVSDPRQLRIVYTSPYPVK